jgi:hypothetical protein
MANVGDRIELHSNGAPRSGVVTAVNGDMITVRWDAGGETSLIPGPGVLSVVTSQQQAPSMRTSLTALAATTPATQSSGTGSRTRAAKRAVAAKKSVAKKPAKKVAGVKKPAAKKVAAVKKPAAKKVTAVKKSTAKKSPVKKVAGAKKPAAKKVAGAKKQAAKGTSISRTIGKKKA